MKIVDASWIVVDVETTGLDPAKDEVVEIGCVATSMGNGALGMWATLVRPRGMIPPELSAVHGITNADVANAPCFYEAMESFAAFVSRFQEAVFAAHTAGFDAAFLGLDKPSQPFRTLCTERLARHLWPGVPNYKNQTLRYWRGHDRVETFGIAPHRVLSDTLVTGRVLIDELENALQRGFTDVEELIEYAESPILFEKWPFGKYRGELIAAAPPSYVSWCLLEMKDLSRDMRFTLEQQLKGAA